MMIRWIFPSIKGRSGKIYRKNIPEKMVVLQDLGKKGKKGKVFFILKKIGDFEGKRAVTKAIFYKLQKTFPTFPNVPNGDTWSNEGALMVKYRNRELHINERVFQECLKLRPAPEDRIDIEYVRAKKRLSRLLQEDDSYDDLIWIICERLGC